jgi:hypothetical protein
MMARVGTCEGRGRRKVGLVDQPAGWWASQWGFPHLSSFSLSPTVAAVVTTAMAEANMILFVVFFFF